MAVNVELVRRLGRGDLVDCILYERRGFREVEMAPVTDSLRDTAGEYDDERDLPLGLVQKRFRLRRREVGVTCVAHLLSKCSDTYGKRADHDQVATRMQGQLGTSARRRDFRVT